MLISSSGGKYYSHFTGGGIEAKRSSVVGPKASILNGKTWDVSCQSLHSVVKL